MLKLAKEQSRFSNCLRRQVGTIIVKNNEIIARGSNQTPTLVKPCESCYRVDNNIKSGTMYETCRSIHAEQQALLNIHTFKAINSTMYIFGHEEVCCLCKRFILNAGIIKVYLQENDDAKIQEINPLDWIKEL